jgi:hypothetical protein
MLFLIFVMLVIATAFLQLSPFRERAKTSVVEVLCTLFFMSKLGEGGGRKGIVREGWKFCDD